MLAPVGAGEIADAVAMLIKFCYEVTDGGHRLALIRRRRVCSCGMRELKMVVGP